jgi:DeoR/GlpR family transcriptional regulator of sugar metabolism
MMVKEKRFNYILDKLHSQNEVGYNELSNDLQVSEDTIRRDIDALANNGLLLKIRGGAIPRSHNPLSFKERQGHLQDDKEIIALKALTLIKPGQTLFMDGGTSVYTLASLLPTNSKLTIITSNLAIIPALSSYPHVELIVLGGKYLKQTETITGYQAIKMVQNFQADLYFIGVCALDMAKGVTASFMEEAELKHAMLEQSHVTVALSTFDKLETFEPYHVCPIKSIHYMITEVDSSHKKLQSFREAGIIIL